MGTAVSAVLVAIACVPMPTPPRVRNFKFLEMPSESQAQITAYVQPMRMLRTCEIQADFRGNASKIRQTADFWLDLFESGHLKDVPRSCAEDTSREGVRAQIFTGRENLCYALMRMARDEVAAGERVTASEDFARAFRLCEILKYADAVTLPASLAAQLNIMRSADEAGLCTEPVLRAAFATAPAWSDYANRLANVIRESATFRYIESDSLSSSLNIKALTTVNAVRSAVPTELSGQEISRMIGADKQMEPELRVLVRVSLRRAIELNTQLNKFGIRSATKAKSTQNQFLVRG